MVAVVQCVWERYNSILHGHLGSFCATPFMTFHRWSPESRAGGFSSRFARRWIVSIFALAMLVMLAWLLVLPFSYPKTHLFILTITDRAALGVPPVKYVGETVQDVKLFGISSVPPVFGQVGCNNDLSSYSCRLSEFRKTDRQSAHSAARFGNLDRPRTWNFAWWRSVLLV